MSAIGVLYTGGAEAGAGIRMLVAQWQLPVFHDLAERILAVRTLKDSFVMAWRVWLDAR